MAIKKKSYSEAITRIEEIVSQIENNEVDIDQLSELLKEAQLLISQCKDRLTKTEQAVNELLTSEEE